MASAGSAITKVVIGALIAVVLLNPLNSVVADSTGTTSVANETVTADNSFQELQGYDIVNGSVTVNDSDGNTVDPGNYTVRHAPGEIRINNSSSTVVSDGEQVDVSYDYQATSGSVTTIALLVPLLAVLLVLVLFTGKIQGMM